MSHPFIKSLSSDFSKVIRQRGLDYYHRGKVRVTEVDPGDPGRVLAFVQGTRRYTVQLGFEGIDITYSCTCPYFFDREKPCKHLWAVLLKLDNSGFFTNWEKARGFVEGDVQPEVLFNSSDTDNRATRGTELERIRLPVPEWRLELKNVRDYQQAGIESRREPWPSGRKILYIFDIPRTLSGGRAIVHLQYRDEDKSDQPRAFAGSGARMPDLWRLADPQDREILGVLRGVSYQNEYDEDSFSYRLLGQDAQLLCPSYRLDVDLVRLLLPKMAESGRLFLKSRPGEGFDPLPVVWDEGNPWELRLRLEKKRTGRVQLEGFLKRGDEEMPLAEPELLLLGGLMFCGGRLVHYSQSGSFAWITVLRRRKHLSVGEEELPELLKELLFFPDLPRLEIGESISIRTIDATPLPRLTVSKADRNRHSPTGGGLIGELSFEYGGRLVAGLPPAAGTFEELEKLLVLRRGLEERRALERLLELGFRHVYEYRSRSKVLKLAARRLPGVVDQLLQEGWQVEAEGKLLRSAASFNIHVTSGIDWLEMHGSARFGDAEVNLPALLKALRRGGNTVRLGDGSFGVLPEQWLKQQGFLLKLGEVQEDHLRFRSSQALMIDLFLQNEPRASSDGLFENLRSKLKRYTGIKPLAAPPGFIGSLRGYQQEGLGWFCFLDEFAFGGCLADDMGLGKTVQVLALLEDLRNRRMNPSTAKNKRKDRGVPSLVVVPKSLVFNWKEEATRFTPQLRILDHTGPWRGKDTKNFARFDVIVTTYGTMRNDIALLKGYPFDYIVLDEAQVIKNAGSVTAKAARLLQGRRRLALSGTPIENHLGELWSLFEFLNPGMLGGVSLFKKHLRSRESLDDGARTILARYLRPFILRRTKEQVAPELPDKVEQTLFCQLEPAERRRYDELKRYYQAALQRRIETEGLGKAKIQVLEALLRLRQAACHPGLLDKKSSSRSSAKLDLLLQHLEDVVAEERKALVFSQFTSLLQILRTRLDQLGFVYEYLDGRTRDRARRVKRFQQDPGCRLFLISLKAGGLGLNLTGAEYVFLLDPWWNPASEAQAIDRTHRIGQDKKVFAYRLIAKDTVEEKVLELQKSKRDLAEAIISQDNRLIGDLSREDLALLLS